MDSGVSRWRDPSVFDGYDFSVSPQSASISASYGNMFPFNATNSSMANATATTLEFRSFTSTPGGGGGDYSMDALDMVLRAQWAMD